MGGRQGLGRGRAWRCGRCPSATGFYRSAEPGEGGEGGEGSVAGGLGGAEGARPPRASTDLQNQAREAREARARSRAGLEVRKVPVRHGLLQTCRTRRGRQGLGPGRAWGGREATVRHGLLQTCRTRRGRRVAPGDGAKGPTGSDQSSAGSLRTMEVDTARDHCRTRFDGWRTQRRQTREQRDQQGGERWTRYAPLRRASTALQKR